MGYGPDKTTYFQQDGATSHTAKIAMNILHPHFPGHLISRYGDIAWPAWSPDLSVCNFYLWGYLKIVVYCAPSPRTTHELKLRIQEEISRIPVDVLRRTMSSVHDRLAEYEQRNGGHLEDVIFRVEWFVSRPLIHLFLQMLKYVLTYKWNCIMCCIRQRKRCWSDVSQILSGQGVDPASFLRRCEGQAMAMKWNFSTLFLIVFTNKQERAD